MSGDREQVKLAGGRPLDGGLGSCFSFGLLNVRLADHEVFDDTCAESLQRKPWLVAERLIQGGRLEAEGLEVEGMAAARLSAILEVADQQGAKPRLRVVRSCGGRGERWETAECA